MSKKALKTVRDRRRKYKAKATETAAPYAPSTFAPPDTTNTSIRNITNYLIEQIISMGMTVIVRDSNIKMSKSKYLSVDAGKRRYKIRISDHPLRRGGKHDFNIYADTPYEKAYHYLDFLEKFREIVGKGYEGQNLAKFSKNGEI